MNQKVTQGLSQVFQKSKPSIYAILLRCIGLFLLVTVSAGCSKDNKEEVSESDDRPNIVIIMADDLGYSDIGCYGGEINTPNLDNLASNGMRFTEFYNTSRCCPTRASMLTGLYPHQAGIGRMTMDTGLPGYRGYLKENTVTIAEVLKAAGYQTGMTGKWHVSITDRLEEEKQLKWLAHQEDYGDFSDTTTYPTARGFDKYYGNIWGVVDYFDPFSLVNGTKPVKDVPDDYYYTTAIGDSSVSYIEQFSKNDKPFFLYVAHCAPHWPLHAPASAIETYKETYKEGWEAIRKNRYEQMIKLGLFDEQSAPLSDRMFADQPWEENPDTVWDARAMAVHAAMVDLMDRSIGNLVDKLEETGELDNTLILFLSDNGASYERPSKYGPGFDRAGSTRDGQEVTFPLEKSEDALPGPQTVHSGIGPVWANVSNTPFRYWKSKNHEGGIATPFIAHWPNGIARKNAITDQPAHVIDLMATCVDLAETGYPETLRGEKITPLQGKSIGPILKGENRQAHQAIFWEHFGAKAIRKGEWKLVKLNNNTDWELYNISRDRTEVNNLAKQYPQKVRELSKLWEQKAEELSVYPAP